MIEISVCKDVDYIRSVIIDDDEMYSRTSDDFTPDNIANYFGSALWLECKRDDKRVGLSAIKVASNSVLNIHIHIPKKHRGKGVIDIGREVLRWVASNAGPSFFKINTKVPVIYKDVIRFAHSLGFKDEGIDRLSIMKSGKLIDRLNLGITFKEINYEHF